MCPAKRRRSLQRVKISAVCVRAQVHCRWFLKFIEIMILSDKRDIFFLNNRGERTLPGGSTFLTHLLKRLSRPVSSGVSNPAWHFGLVRNYVTAK